MPDMCYGQFANRRQSKRARLITPDVCIPGDKHSSVGWPFQDVLHITRCILHPADGCHSYVGWLASKMCCTSLDAFCILHMASILMLDGLFKMCCTSHHWMHFASCTWLAFLCWMACFQVVLHITRCILHPAHG